MVEALINCEPDMLQVCPMSHILDEDQRLLVQLADLYDREFVGIVGWAKQVPGFGDLSLHDQMRLLSSTWIEIHTFCLSWRSISNAGKLIFAHNFFLDERIAKKCYCFELYSHCITIVENIKHLGLMQEEYFILKALILANSDVKLDEPQSLYRFRESILNWLSDSITTTRRGQFIRATQYMFLVLPSLRQADEITRQFWSRIYWSGKVPMSDLFIEMLGIPHHQQI